MDSFHFRDIRVEKANAISRYRRIQRITTLFRFVELFVFLIIVSRFSAQFVLSSKLSSEYFRGVSVALISPRFVFFLGNAIVLVLYLKSGRFSEKNGEKINDFYDEYVEKCRKNEQLCSKEEKKASDTYKHGVCYEDRKLHRSNSQNLERTIHEVARRRELKRSMTEGCRKSPDCGRKVETAAEAADSSSYVEDEMSSEEFRRTVEAFIARQQRFLREEEEVSVIES